MRTFYLLLVGLIAGVIAAPGFAQQNLQVPDSVAADVQVAKGAPKVYLVRMSDDPVVAYDGEIAQLKATRPKAGKKIDPNSSKVQQYVRYLERRHDKAIAAVGGEKVYSYRYSFNGFAAVLTSSQVAQVAARSDVIAVWVDERRFPTTEQSPSFLGLNDLGSGLHANLGLFGEDVIVGVIDTGIWPEHPSFSDRVDLSDPGGSSGAPLAYGPPPAGWHGTCQSGELWSQDDCNNKLIGARYYQEGFGFGGSGLLQQEYLSARDSDGHGSHTSSTAAGNADVPSELLGNTFGLVSGMAPRARIAMYKACWNNAGCFGSDLVAAIDQAVADGVDVINYSIGSSSTALGADDIAFLFAADAGVFVATSAGNSGPGAGTIGSPSWNPWLITVGASTEDRTFQGSTTLGNASEFFGASLTGGTSNLTLVDSEDVGSELCIPGELDPAAVAGNIVLCRRGAIARVDKSRAVAIAGGAGTILYNASDTDTQNADAHHTPAVHINNTDGLAVKAYIDAEGAGATSRINAGSPIIIAAPDMASFSSRGPNGASADIIKPDITAPGVNILAANTPTPYLGAPGQLFQVISGTSMSSPHTAGIGALLTEAHPDWTPAQIKSALMTTTYQTVNKEDGATPADPFDMGAGHLNPNPAADPGLTYDAGFFEYLGFLCGAVPGSVSSGFCAFLDSLGIPLDPSDLNIASIGIGDLAGFQTVTRCVTNVGGSTATYNVTTNPPPGTTVSVSPTSLTLAAGQEGCYDVLITNDSAPLGTFTFGSLHWNDGMHHVYSPIAVRPIQLSAPAEIAGSGASGAASFDVVFGYTGTYTADPHGLIQGTEDADNVVDDPSNDINTALDTGVGVTFHFITVPARTLHSRFSLFDDFTDGNDDLDLYIFGPDTAGFPFVGGSGSGTSAEEVNLDSPASGTYIAVVHGWQTDGPDANYTLFDWSVPSATGGNLSIDAAPTSATLGSVETIDVSWSGLAAGKHLGAVSHSDGGAVSDSDGGPKRRGRKQSDSDGGGVIDLTLISVEAP